MVQKSFAKIAFGVLGWLAACGGSERNYDTSTAGGAAGAPMTTGGGAGSSSTGSGGHGGATGGQAGTGTSDAQPGSGGSAEDAARDVSMQSDASLDSSPTDTSIVDSPRPEAEAAREATIDAPPDVPPDVPKSCKNPPLCSNATSQVSCQGIRGCYWSQCVFKTPGLGVACGAEGLDRANNCPPGCHYMTNCVGNGNNDYYGSPDNCGAASRQTMDSCVGVGSVWQMCVWKASVACVGTPVRTDCTGIVDPIICVQEGCSWQ